MKKIFVIYLIFFVVVLTPIIYATPPDYQVVLTLENRNVNPNEKIDYSIDIIGDGPCMGGYIYIIPEGRTNVSEFKLYYTNSSDPNTFKLVSINNIMHGPFIDSSCKGQPGLSKRLYIPLNINQLHEINQIRIDGKLYALPDSEGGDYTFNVLFKCQSIEGKYYSFKTENQFHVKYWLEKWQYLIPLLLFIFGILFDQYLLSRKRKKKESRTKNES